MTIKSSLQQAVNRDRMITQLDSNWDQVHWRDQLKDVVTNNADLLDMVQLAGKIETGDHSSFSVRVPRRWVQRIKKGDANDPILLQILAQPAENATHPGYSADPLQESRFIPVNGVIHKYRSRALLVLTSACAVNCRYCFRRSFPYSENTLSGERLQHALDYIRNNTDIFEVILSGGDPLMASNEWLEQVIKAVQTIDHVTNLRIHSRLPIMIPERIDDGLLSTLSRSRLFITLVLHCNHYQEIPNELGHYVRRLMGIGVHTLNQSVLLRGINDSIETLATLSRELNRHSIMPYYLHELDPVAGAAHFRIESESEVKKIYQGLLETLPGFLVPRLVREKPGHKSKSPVCTHCYN